jgi:transposase-like protein
MRFGMTVSPERKAECVRLRIEEHLSIREIHERTGVAQGTLSPWLKAHPLPQSVVAQKRAAVAPAPTSREERYPNTSPFKGFMKSVESLSRREKGRIAEAAVLLRLTLLGLVPAKPVFDGETSDWLVEIPGTTTVRRVQVKWMKTANHGKPFAALTSTGSGGKVKVYTPMDFDVIVGYDINTDTCHVWDWPSIGQKGSAVSASESSQEAWHRLQK